MRYPDRTMNLDYLVPRLIRHFMPERVTRFLLMRSWIIRPGLETSDPLMATRRYIEVLQARGLSLSGRRVLVFGYGGRFDIGIHLLEAGAGHVVLYDKFAPPDDLHNEALLARYPAYAGMDGTGFTPSPERITILRDDMGGIVAGERADPADYVVSTSVYEHLADVEGSTRALAGLMRRDGLQIHFVDLRDHFFRYPFEMLHYSDQAWRRWLNPTSNHNRYRLWDYERAFEACFRRVEIEILERDVDGFARARDRIRPEFKRGVVMEDAVTLIRIVAGEPRQPA